MKRFMMLMLPVLLVFGVCAGADRMDIHSMVVGDKALEILDSQQITKSADGIIQSLYLSPNGKNIVYTAKPSKDDDSDLLRLSLANTSGGRPTMLFDSWQYLPLVKAKEEPKPGTEVWIMINPESIKWSPDSRTFAYSIEKITFVQPQDADKLDDDHPKDEETPPKVEECLQIYSYYGKRLASIPLPGEVVVKQLEWSPDAKNIAILTEEINGNETALFVVNVNTGEVTPLIPDVPGASIQRIIGWVNKGMDIQYLTAKPEEEDQIREFNLETRTSKSIRETSEADDTSPDGSLKTVDQPASDTVAFKNILTDKTIEVKLGKAWDFIGFTPDSRTFAFYKTEETKIGDGSKTGKFTSLWLAVPEERKCNQMCLALECDKDAYGVGLKPSWSSDASKVAYSSQGRAYLLELGLRDPNLNEKAEAGLLSEDDEKEMLADNAKQVGLALNMYAADWDNTLPQVNGFADAVKPYMKDGSILNRPGTDKVAFQLLPFHRLEDIIDPAATILGFFDIGYKWKVVLYADWHVAVVPKD